MRRLIWIALLAAGCATSPAVTPSTVGKSTVVRQTDRSLDLAIDGDGFFIVQTPAGGFLFTRHGELAVSGSGELVNGDGYRIYPTVEVAGSANVTVSPDGVVHRDTAAGAKEVAGQIVLSRFKKSAALEADGEYRLPTESSGDPITGKPGTKGLGTITAGRLEE